MNIKRFFCLIGLSLVITFSIAFEGWTQTKPETKAPVITHSYGVEKGKYGYIWKIYIEAEDPDGDMLKIASVVHQVGYGHYPPDWIHLKPQYRKHLKGYIQWNTFSSKGPVINEWTRITLKVSIFDKAGNESNEVVFPFTFETGVRSEPKPLVPFDQGEIPKLGNIHIDLMGANDDGKSLREE